jgi:uncharacterized membrane protein YphA (DoxX/SURF4 family)
MTFADGCSIALAVVFVIAGVSKLASLTWPVQARALAVPPFVVPAVPVAEIVLGAGAITGFQRWILIAMLLMLVAFTGVLVFNLARGRRPPCACFGGRTPRPISWLSVVRNLVFVGLAIAALAAG